MTAFEADDDDRRRRRRPRVPARRAPRRRPRAARLHLPARAARPHPRGRAHARPRGSRRRRCPTSCARSGVARDLGHAAHARADQVEARRARPAAERGAAGDRPRGDADRDRPVPARVRAHGALDPGLRRRRARDAGGPDRRTPATTSSTTRPSTACAPTSAGSPRSATAASTSCSATRRTPSARASRGPSASSARRSGRSSRTATGPHPRLLVRLQHPPHAAGDRRRRRRCDRKVCVVGRSMRKNLNIARNLGYVDVPDGDADQAGRPRRVPARTRC